MGLHRFVQGIVGLVFAGAGLVFIGSLWTASGFGAPPFFFRLFGTLVALIFVVTGGAVAVRGFMGKKDQAWGPVQKWMKKQRRRTSRRPEPPGGGSYTCPNCGADIEKGEDVSPSGDAKCTYCDKWFNVHEGTG